MSNDSDVMKKVMQDIADEGKQNKLSIEGHKAAAVVYREHNMEGAAMLLDNKVAELEKQNEWLKQEWHRIKKELQLLPF